MFAQAGLSQIQLNVYASAMNRFFTSQSSAASSSAVQPTLGSASASPSSAVQPARTAGASISTKNKATTTAMLRHAPPADSPWPRRHLKRNNAINHVKRSKDYVEMLLQESTKQREELDRPPTPDPRDRSKSKRQWEASVKAWIYSIHAIANPMP
jgi:hypothetical protein